MIHNIYIYISKVKVDQLSDQSTSFISDLVAKLQFKLPFVSGEISGSGQNVKGTIAKLERILPKILSEYTVKPFSELSKDKSPVFMSFQGKATRHVADDHFWLAMEYGDTALLLAGSASYAIGGNGNIPANISPSADPVLSFLHASMNKDSKKDSNSSENLSYVWQELMREPLCKEIDLPCVEGIAVFAATIPASKAQMRRVQRTNINTIVIGTPLFIKQVGS